MLLYAHATQSGLWFASHRIIVSRRLAYGLPPGRLSAPGKPDYHVLIRLARPPIPWPAAALFPITVIGNSVRKGRYPNGRRERGGPAFIAHVPPILS